MKISAGMGAALKVKVTVFLFMIRDCFYFKIIFDIKIKNKVFYPCQQHIFVLKLIETLTERNKIVAGILPEIRFYRQNVLRNYNKSNEIESDPVFYLQSLLPNFHSITKH